MLPTSIVRINVPMSAQADKGKQPQEVEEESGQARPHYEERDFTIFEGSSFSNPELALEMLKSTILGSDWSVTKTKRMEEVRHTIYQDILKVVQFFCSPLF